MESAAPQPEQSAARAPRASEGPFCPACGTTARRTAARFCAVCGRALNESSYLPADTLRASYHLQPQRIISRSHRRISAQPQRPVAFKKVSPARNYNGAATTALAFVTYSLVPYLGILFCPGALVMGGLGLLSWYRSPQRGGRRASYAALVLGLVILCVQIFLWWILYKVPQWAQL